MLSNSQFFRNVVESIREGANPQDYLCRLIGNTIDQSDDATSIEPCLWITPYDGAPFDDSLILFKDNKLHDFRAPDNRHISPTDIVPEPHAPEGPVIAARVKEHENTIVLGYCHSNVRLPFDTEELDCIGQLIGNALLNVRVRWLHIYTSDAIEALAKKLVDGLSEKNDTITFEEIIDSASSAIQPSCIPHAVRVLGMDIAKWRSQRPLNETAAQEGSAPQSTLSDSEFTDDFLYRYSVDLAEFIQQQGQQENPLIRKHEKNSPASAFSDEPDNDIFSIDTPLYKPKTTDTVFGIPFVSILYDSTETALFSADEVQRLRYFLSTLRRIALLRQHHEHTSLSNQLLHDVGSLQSPGDVAKETIDFIDQQYQATEVAILEKQGNYLSVLSATENIKPQNIPPLFIEGQGSIACDVAISGEENYEPDCRKNIHYLPVVRETITQYTTPLKWQNKLAGVLLIGIAQPDALPESDLESIRAIATNCAETLFSIQRQTHTSAIIYRTSDALSLARWAIRYALEASEKHEETILTSMLGSTDRNLSNTISMIEGLRLTEAPELIAFDVSALLDELFSRTSELFEELADLYREFEIEKIALKTSLPTPTYVRASRTGLKLAIREVLKNAIESTIARMDAEKLTETPPITVELHEDEQTFSAEPNTYRFAVITVTDQGEGIPVSDQDKPLILLYTSRGRDKHLGVGLNLASRALTGFGGRLQFESTDDDEDGHAKTTKFSLFVPFTASDPQ